MCGFFGSYFLFLTGSSGAGFDAGEGILSSDILLASMAGMPVTGCEEGIVDSLLIEGVCSAVL